ncbi:MAG: hypothetical protein RBT20_14255, partial [Syntrophales bacterium]|nr:hypothetical protein [Syntrophales bacterium]
GGLHRILAVLAENENNVEYMYAFDERSGQNAVMIFRFEEPDAAIDVLRKVNINVLPGDKLYAL